MTMQITTVKVSCPGCQGEIAIRYEKADDPPRVQAFAPARLVQKGTACIAEQECTNCGGVGAVTIAD